MGTFTVTQNFTDSVKPSGVYDGVNQIFLLPAAPTPAASLYLVYNGLLLTQDLDYHLVGNQITLIYLAPSSTDIFTAFYRTLGSAVELTQNISTLEVPSGIVNGINKIFTLAITPNPPSSLIVAVNGLTQTQGIDYTLAGNTITFIFAPLDGALLVAGYRYYSIITDRFHGELKSDLVPYIRNYLNDPAGVLWTDTQLTRFINQGEVDITQRLAIYWAKFPLALTNGVGLYTMPANLRGITRMTYRGTPVEMLTQSQLGDLTPTYRTQISRVMYASLQFEGYYTLRLFCTPYENLPAISVGNEIYTDKNILNEFQISAYFFATESNPYSIVPDYLFRRTVRYFVCWKAFIMEGDGQDIQVGGYYAKKYEAQIQNNERFVSKIYAAKERQLQPGYLNNNRRVARPVLPPNFGPTIL